MTGWFIPADSGWNKWWILMWWTFTPSWVIYSLVTRDFSRGHQAAPKDRPTSARSKGLEPLTF